MEQVTDLIVDVPNFPKKGVIFKDITPVLEDFNAFMTVMENMAQKIEALENVVDKIAGLEARGFVFASALSAMISSGLVLIRKKGKLPRASYSQISQLEYGEETFEIHKDSVKLGERIVIVDDVLATGGTALSAARLIEQCGGEVEAFVFMIELKSLGGRKKLEGYNIESLIQYE